MIKVKPNTEIQYCVHCVSDEKTFTVSIKSGTGMQFTICEKCAKKLLVELTKALRGEMRGEN